MDAPTYPPAVAFELPVAAPYVLKLEEASLVEIKANPAAWGIVVKHMPLVKAMINIPTMKSQLGNMTVRSLQDFVNVGSPETFAIVDQELARLPAGSAAP